MYANKKYNEEREELISILKGFDFCYMDDVIPSTTRKYQKIANELDERLVKLGKKKGIETLEMVANTRGGDVYRVRCPSIFPKLYGEEKEKNGGGAGRGQCGRGL
jgi:hypothetical protein